MFIQDRLSKGEPIDQATLKAAVKSGVSLLGNATAHFSTERRKCVMKHLNSDLKPLAEGQFPDRGAYLFGDSFGARAKAAADSVKALNGIQPRKRFLGNGGSKFKPRVASSSGVFQRQGLRSRYSNDWVHIRAAHHCHQPGQSSSPGSNLRNSRYQTTTRQTIMARSHYQTTKHSVPSVFASPARVRPGSPSVPEPAGRENGIAQYCLEQDYLQPLGARNGYRLDWRSQPNQFHRPVTGSLNYLQQVP